MCTRKVIAPRRCCWRLLLPYKQPAHLSDWAMVLFFLPRWVLQQNVARCLKSTLRGETSVYDWSYEIYEKGTLAALRSGLKPSWNGHRTTAHLSFVLPLIPEANGSLLVLFALQSDYVFVFIPVMCCSRLWLNLNSYLPSNFGPFVLLPVSCHCSSFQRASTIYGHGCHGDTHNALHIADFQAGKAPGEAERIRLPCRSALVKPTLLAQKENMKPQQSRSRGGKKESRLVREQRR